MGYTTKFQGTLQFTKDLTAQELAYLNKILGVDFRENAFLKSISTDGRGAVGDNYAIDLELTKSFDGLKWDGSEKSYGMEKQVQFVINYMKKKYPDFGLKGFFSAQGEEVEDRWRLEIQDGNAVKVETPPKGKKITCPNCEASFFVDCES